MSPDDKREVQLEHQEHADLDLKADADFVQLAEEVQYGYTGARAMFASPYILGAAMLASMGGFSYGYGRHIVQTSCCEQAR
jgi:hypothetical protein